MLRRLGAFFLALAWPAWVHAQDTQVIPLMGGTAAPVVYVGPGDKVGSASAYYSLGHAYSSTQADGSHTSGQIRNQSVQMNAQTATNVLTVNSISSGTIYPGMQVVRANGTTSLGTINAYGSGGTSGTGSTGTYQLSTGAGTIAAESMTASEACDILLTTSGLGGNLANCSGTGSGSNGTTPSAWCALGGAKCWVVKVYNQVSPGTLDIIQTANLGNQPTFHASGHCIANGYCWELVGSSTVNLTSANNFTPASGVVTFETVYNRTVLNTSSYVLLYEDGTGSTNRITTFTANSKVNLAGGGTNVQENATDAAWHEVIGVINTTSSAVNVDGTENTSLSVTGVTTAGKPETISGGTIETDVAEAAFWDATAFTTGGGGQSTSVCNNVQGFYGPGNFAGTGTRC